MVMRACWVWHFKFYWTTQLTQRLADSNTVNNFVSIKKMVLVLKKIGKKVIGIVSYKNNLVTPITTRLKDNLAYFLSRYLEWPLSSANSTTNQSVALTSTVVYYYSIIVLAKQAVYNRCAFVCLTRSLKLHYERSRTSTACCSVDALVGCSQSASSVTHAANVTVSECAARCGYCHPNTSQNYGL